MQWNPPPADLRISRFVPQSSHRNHITRLALQDADTPFANAPCRTSDYPAIVQQQATSIPRYLNYCYNGELKPQVCYLRPEIGWSQQEHFQHHRPPPQYPDMRLITEREIEKEQIREEMIRSDIARRHVLEAEVRRVLIMMERDSVPLSSLRTLMFDSLMRLPCSVTRAEERWVLVDIIVKLLEERERSNGMHARGRLDTLPIIQRGSSHLKISEVRPAVHEDNIERKVLLLPKPNDNACGSKRKAETPDAIMTKKAKVAWSCAVCKFNGTSEQHLNEHLQGRKHKNEECKMRRAQSGSKNSRIGKKKRRKAHKRSKKRAAEQNKLEK